MYVSVPTIVGMNGAERTTDASPELLIFSA